MSKEKGTSSAPMVLGLIGGVLGLPAAVCSGMCASAVETLTDDTGSGLTEFYLYGTAILSIAIIIVSCFTKKSPKIAGIIMIVCSLAAAVLFMVTYNVLGIISVILSVIGGVIALVQKKEVVE